MSPIALLTLLTYYAASQDGFSAMIPINELSSDNKYRVSPAQIALASNDLISCRFQEQFYWCLQDNVL